MNFTYLRTFVTVCKSGNFTEAANKLFIPQPTVSNRIDCLEEELGQSLFLKKDKGKRSMALSQAGEKFLPHAQRIIDSFESVKEELNASNQTKTIRIASTIPQNHSLILSKIDSLLDEYNYFNIQFSSVAKADVIPEMIEKNVDLAFVTEPIYSQSIESTLLTSDHFELMIPLNHDLSATHELTDVDVLKNENMVLYNHHLLHPYFAKQIYQCCNHVITTDDVEFIKNMLQTHKAITILPSSFMNNIEGMIRRIPISESIQDEKISYYMVYDQKNGYEQKYFYEGLLIN